MISDVDEFLGYFFECLENNGDTSESYYDTRYSEYNAYVNDDSYVSCMVVENDGDFYMFSFEWQDEGHGDVGICDVTVLKEDSTIIYYCDPTCGCVDIKKRWIEDNRKWDEEYEWNY